MTINADETKETAGGIDYKLLQLFQELEWKVLKKLKI